MGPLFGEHFRDHQVNISSLNPPPGGHASHHFWFMHILAWILFNTYFVSGTRLAEATRVSMLAITGISSVIRSALFEEFWKRPFAPAPIIFSHVSVASVTFLCPVLVLLVYLSLFLALNIPLPHGQKELDLQEAIHTYSPCQPNLRQAQLCDQQPLFLVPFLVCDLGLFFLKTQNFFVCSPYILRVSRARTCQPAHQEVTLIWGQRKTGEVRAQALEVSFFLSLGGLGGHLLCLPPSLGSMGESRWSLGSGASSPHPTQTESASWRRTRGERETEKTRASAKKVEGQGWGWRRIRDKTLVPREKKGKVGRQTTQKGAALPACVPTA